MKRFIFLVLCCSLLFSCCKKNPADCGRTFADTLLNHKTARAFGEGTVKDSDLKQILQAGINSPSGLNYQPWHFTVVNDNQYLTNLHNDAKALIHMDNGKKANKLDLTCVTTAIIISSDDSKNNSAFDCGLACQSMSDYAVLIGYDTKIFGMQNAVLNGPDSAKYRQELGIPNGFTPIALLALGCPTDQLDGLSAATTRKSFEDVVNYK